MGRVDEGSYRELHLSRKGDEQDWRIGIAQKRRAISGREAMVGAIGVAKSDLDPHGSVFVEGEWWGAIAEGGPIKKGERILVKKLEGMKLVVEKAKEEG